MIDPHSWHAGASVDVSNVSLDDSLAAVRVTDGLVPGDASEEPGCRAGGGARGGRGGARRTRRPRGPRAAAWGAGLRPGGFRTIRPVVTRCRRVTPFAPADPFWNQKRPAQWSHAEALKLVRH